MKTPKTVAEYLNLAMLGALEIYEDAEKRHQEEGTEVSHREVNQAWETVQDLMEMIKEYHRKAE